MRKRLRGIVAPIVLALICYLVLSPLTPLPAGAVVCPTSTTSKGFCLCSILNSTFGLKTKDNWIIADSLFADVLAQIGALDAVDTSFVDSLARLIVGDSLAAIGNCTDSLVSCTGVIVVTDTLRATSGYIIADSTRGSAKYTDSLTVHRTAINANRDSITVHRTAINGLRDSVTALRSANTALADSVDSLRADIMTQRVFHTTYTAGAAALFDGNSYVDSTDAVIFGGFEYNSGVTFDADSTGYMVHTAENGSVSFRWRGAAWTGGNLGFWYLVIKQ